MGFPEGFFEVIVESYEDVIVLSGALRSNFWETLHTAISLTLKRHPSGVIIDCSGLTEATAEGAETFRDVMEFIHHQDARVIVAAVPDNVLDVLRTVPDVRSQLPVTDSVESARRSLDLVIEPKVSKKRGSNGATAEKVVICLSGKPADREALRVASNICEVRECELHLVYVVIVPRDLPLTAPLPKEEGVAASALDSAKTLVDKHTRWFPHLERGRDIVSTLEDFLAEVKASLIIFPLPQGQEHEGNGQLIRASMSKIRQEIIFVRGPNTDA